jgi:hypothetical protein
MQSNGPLHQVQICHGTNYLQLTVPLCMVATVTHNAGVVASPIYLYVTCNAGLVATSENV